MVSLLPQPWRCTMQRARCLAVLLIAIASVDGVAAEPIVSGLKPGQRPGAYSALVSVGLQRGQSHCFICETADRPDVIVFARQLSDPLGKLARGLDKAMTDHKDAELRAWVTILSDDQTALDPKVVNWSKKHALRGVPVAVFEDVVGPPSYLIGRDTDV